MGFKSPFMPNGTPGCPPAHGNCHCSCHTVPGTKHIVACCWPEQDEQKSVLRRIAERGLRAAQDEDNSQMIDCWQHLLDELERAEGAQ